MIIPVGLIISCICFHGQNGVTSSIKPQQITYIVPGVENFDHTEIPDFIQKAQNNLVGSPVKLVTNLSSCLPLYAVLYVSKYCQYILTWCRILHS